MFKHTARWIFWVLVIPLDDSRHVCVCVCLSRLFVTNQLTTLCSMWHTACGKWHFCCQCFCCCCCRLGMACRLSYFQYMICSQIVICICIGIGIGMYMEGVYGPLESVLTLCYAPHCSSLTNAVLSPDTPAHSRHCSVTYRRGHARCRHPSASAVLASSAAIPGMSLIKKLISINSLFLSLSLFRMLSSWGDNV